MKKDFFKRFLSSVILLPISFFFLYQGSYLFNFFIITCFFISAYEWHKMSKKKVFAYIGFVFLIFSFYTLYKLRNDFLIEVTVFVLLICVSTDTGGYLFGKFFKGPKLTKISPKKTYSGTIGGYVFSVAALLLYTSFINSSIFIQFNKEIFYFVVIISTVSQLGDIFISYFKRLSKIKDTGKIIPGHGGILDRIDGMIFAIPFSYILLKLNLLNLL